MIPATARPLETLLERLRAALVAVANAGSLEHRRARVAMEHLEFEIAPLLEAIDLEAITTAIQLNAVAEYKRKQAQPPREALPLSSAIAILPGQRATITTRPQRSAMRIDTIVCSSPNFLIHDVVIGNRSQFAQSGAIPSSAFMVSTDGFSPRLVFETIQTAMDLVIEVEYIGENPQGEPFRAVALGVTEFSIGNARQFYQAGDSGPIVDAIEPLDRPATPTNPTPAGPDEARAILSAWQQVVNAANSDTDGDIGEMRIAHIDGFRSVLADVTQGIESIHPNGNEDEIIGAVIDNANTGDVHDRRREPWVCSYCEGFNSGPNACQRCGRA